MNYTDLTTHIEDICETSFTAAQLALFVAQAEQKIRNMVQFPALRKTCEGATTGDVPYLSVPSDFVHMHSISLRDDNGDHNYLIQVDPNFILEAYPDPTTTGQPQYYGHFDADSLILGPTPTKSWLVRITYGWYPESIVTAGTTWLGDNFDTALLNGALVEALRFMKGEPDLVAMYDKMYMEAITLLKMLGDGKLRQDSYRSGQIRIPVS
jgi:hypothetical protein